MPITGFSTAGLFFPGVVFPATDSLMLLNAIDLGRFYPHTRNNTSLSSCHAQKLSPSLHHTS